MTYADYYKEQYKIIITDFNQPLLLSRVKVKNGYHETHEIKVISIIPEVIFFNTGKYVRNLIILFYVCQICFVCGMKQENRVDKTVMKDVSRYTFCTPAQKCRALSSFLTRLNGNLNFRKVLNV